MSSCSYYHYAMAVATVGFIIICVLLNNIDMALAIKFDAHHMSSTFSSTMRMSSSRSTSLTNPASMCCAFSTTVGNSNTLQQIIVNNLTMSKFTEKMTQHTERLATARTQFGEVSDVQIQRFEDDLRSADCDDGFMLGADMPFWQRDRLGLTTFRAWKNQDGTKSGLNTSSLQQELQELPTFLGKPGQIYESV